MLDFVRVPRVVDEIRLGVLDAITDEYAVVGLLVNGPPGVKLAESLREELEVDAVLR